jgi:hypothetical protein
MEETRNRKGYIVNDQGRECTKCWEFKLWHCFYEDKNQKVGYKAQCKDCGEIYKKRKNTDPKRIELFNNIERKCVSGDVREDGMVFFCYNIDNSPKRNFEKWGTKEAYNKYIINRRNSDERRRVRYSKIEKKHKRGDIRADGMKFWRYDQTYATTDFGKWATDAEFDILQFNETKRSYMTKSFGKFGKKDEPSDEIIGLNDHDLSCYIESLFEEGMTWKNRGNWKGEWDPENPKWHLDHIIPLDAANTLEEAKMLWHYTNLRPMWGNENLSKSNKHCKKELEAYFEERKAVK